MFSLVDDWYENLSLAQGANGEWGERVIAQHELSPLTGNQRFAWNNDLQMHKDHPRPQGNIHLGIP